MHFPLLDTSACTTIAIWNNRIRNLQRFLAEKREVTLILHNCDKFALQFMKVTYSTDNSIALHGKQFLSFQGRITTEDQREYKSVILAAFLAKGLLFAYC